MTHPVYIYIYIYIFFFVFVIKMYCTYCDWCLKECQIINHFCFADADTNLISRGTVVSRHQVTRRDTSASFMRNVILTDPSIIGSQ